MEVEAGREVDSQRDALREAAVLRREEHPARLAAHRQVDACKCGNLGRPGTRRTRDGAGRDGPARRLDADDAPGADVDPGRGAALANVQSTRVPLHDRLRRRVAVELA